MRSRCLFAAALIVFTASIATAQARTVVATPEFQVTANLSPGIRAGDVLYTSGQLPGVRGQPMDTTIQGQTRQALDKIKAIVEAGGTTMPNVTKCTVFLIDVKDFQGMNSVYREFWPKDPPARSTVVVAALVSAGAKLEIECMASVPR